MTNPNEKPTPLPPKVVLTVLVTTVVTVVVLLVLFIVGGDDDTPANQQAEQSTDITVGGTAPSPSRTEAKPSTSLESVPGCGELSEADVDELLASLHDQDATVELSAGWEGDTPAGQQDMAALMVRSGEGTIDNPHLVWVNVDGDWQAATPATAAASTSVDASEDTALTPGVAQVSTCLTAGSR